MPIEGTSSPAHYPNSGSLWLLRIQLAAATKEIEQLTHTNETLVRDVEAMAGYVDEYEEAVRAFASDAKPSRDRNVPARSIRRRSFWPRPAAELKAPARPLISPDATRRTPRANSRYVADAVLSELQRRDAPVLDHLRTLNGISHRLSGWWARQLALVAVGTRWHAPELTVDAIDAIFDFSHDSWNTIAHQAGPHVAEYLLRRAMIAYSQVGRHDEVERILGLPNAPRSAVVTLDIAQMVRRRDPERAWHLLSSLDIDLLSGPNQVRARRLAAHLDEQSALQLAPTDPEALLASANAALARGDHRRYRSLVNEYVTRQGLTPLLDDSDAPFSFHELHTQSLPPVDGPLVSVIVAAYNAAETLPYAVASLLSQTYQRLEIIIVDDASTDATSAIAHELASQDARVSVLRREVNGGVFAARNGGASAANGQYITFHDADDWAHPERIARHMDVMRQHPECRFTLSQMLRVRESGTINFRRWDSFFTHPSATSMFFTREAIDAVGEFDSVRIAADSEYLARAWLHYGRESGQIIPHMLTLSLLSSGSLTQKGPGAWNDDFYSPHHAAYTLSYAEWHASSPTLPYRPQPHAVRPFWAADAILAAGPSDPAPHPLTGLAANYPTEARHPQVLYLLLARRSKELNETIRALASQTDGHWRAVFATSAAEAGAITSDDLRLIHLVDDQLDEAALVAAAAAQLRWLGGGHLVVVPLGASIGPGYTQQLRNDLPLDADDSVTHQVFSRSQLPDHPNGYVNGRPWSFLNAENVEPVVD